MRIRFRMILVFFVIGVVPILVLVILGRNVVNTFQHSVNAEVKRISANISLGDTGNVNAQNVSSLMERISSSLDRSLRSAQSQLNLVSIILLVVVIGGVVFLADWMVTPFEKLVGTSKRAWIVIQNTFTNVPPSSRQDEIGILGHTLGIMETQLKEEFTNLEKQIDLRTSQLQQRTRQLHEAAEIIQDTAEIIDVRHLISGLVSLISERYGYYHVGIYLLDAKAEQVVLQASYLTDAGVQTPDRKYKFGESIVGYVAQRGEIYLASDLTAEDRFIRPSELTLSRSSATFPLKARANIIGVLDIHSSAHSSFSEDDVAVLRILGDQISLAIDNARLFDSARIALESERRAYGEISRLAWSELVSSHPEWGYRSDSSGLYISQGEWQPWMLEAARQAQPVVRQTGDKKIASIPVKVRDQVIGVLDFRKSGEGDRWTEEEIALLNSFSDQLGQALEGARLYQETQLRAEREHILSDISSKVRASTNINTILQVAVRELANALRISKTSIHLHSEPNLDSKITIPGESNGGSSHE